jgi:mannose-1-phosphate guanylyltransferase/mannose-6-phosphate isomerase
MLHAIIMAGGTGTRFWPASRNDTPKQMLELVGGATMIRQTVDRLGDLVPPDRRMVVTNRRLVSAIGEQLPEMSVSALVGEPCKRDTAPCIGLAAMLVTRDDPEATLVVMPADHVIRPAEKFQSAIREAAALVATSPGRIVTFGIKPTYPAEIFGYIHRGQSIPSAAGEAPAFVVNSFKEKPYAETARKYVESGEYYWNSGIFVWQASTILDALRQRQPEMFAHLEKITAAWDTAARDAVFEREFTAIKGISIDYAVMEHAPRRAVVPASFDWSDIGSWKAVSDLEPESDEHGNRVRGQAILIESSNCYIQSDKRMVAAVGVRDLVIVDTDDAVLVADRDRAQQVKLVVDRLRADKHDAAAFHQTVHRPWGSYTVLEDADDCKVKRLVVKPGHVLSLQKHHRRSEHWTVVRGTAKVRVGEREFLLNANESTYIPIDTLHRLENPTAEDIHLIEVQCGDYFGEDDIVRLEDRYGRAARG